MTRRAGWPTGSGQRAAQARTTCPHCPRRLRPCNLARHVRAKHPAADDPTPDEKVLALIEARGRRWRNKRSEQSTMVRSVVGGNVYVSDVVTGRSRSLPSASFLRLYESEDALG